MDTASPEPGSHMLWGVCPGDDASWRSVVAVGEVKAGFGKHKPRCDSV